MVREQESTLGAEIEVAERLAVCCAGSEGEDATSGVTVSIRWA